MRGCKFMKVTEKRLLSSVLAVVSIVGMISVKACAQNYLEKIPMGIASAASTAYITPPTDFKITLGDSYADISWEPVEGADQYSVYRYDEETGEYKYLDFTRKTTFRVWLARGVTSKFKVVSERNMVLSEKSKEIAIKTTIISPPTLGQTIFGKENELAWTEVRGANYYKVYRYNPKKEKYKLVEETTNTFYTDNNVKYGKTYSYKVSAVCDTGTSKLSEEYTLTIPEWEKPLISAEFRSSDIKLEWDSIRNANSYNVYRYNEKTKKYTLVKNTEWAWYIDEKIKPGKTYTYKVCAVGKYGKGEYSNIVSASVPNIKLPTAPVITSTDSDLYSVSFSWDPVKDADYYIIYQYNPKTRKYEKFDTTTGTGGSIHMLSENTTYYFKIAAKNMVGTGPMSKQITITTKKRSSDSSSGSSSDHSLTWVCPACGTTNYDFGGWSFACTNCKNMKPTKDTWTCPRCGTTNFNWGTGICTNCKNLKP